MMYRISILTNAALGLLFIFLGIIGTVYSKSPDSSAVFVLLFILFGYGIFLFFDLVCYRILTLNKERTSLPGWIKNNTSLIFILGILALLSIIFMLTAATYAYIADVNTFTKRQRPYYIAFLFLLMLSVMTWIFNAVGYFRSLKENKQILSEYINDIGASQ